MSKELIERLREPQNVDIGYYWNLADEAADEIERLTAELAEANTKHANLEEAFLRQRETFGATISDRDSKLAALRSRSANTQAQSEPFGWMHSGSLRLMDEADARMEAKHCGGTCYAFPVFRTPQPASAEVKRVLNDLREFYLNSESHTASEQAFLIAALDDVRAAKQKGT